MKVTVDVEKLLPLLKSFYELSGIKVAIYDNKFELVLAYPSHGYVFCTMLNQCEELQAKCDSCIVRLCRRSV